MIIVHDYDSCIQAMLKLENEPQTYQVDSYTVDIRTNEGILAYIGPREFSAFKREIIMRMEDIPIAPLASYAATVSTVDTIVQERDRTFGNKRDNNEFQWIFYDPDQFNRISYNLEQSLYTIVFDATKMFKTSPQSLRLTCVVPSDAHYNWPIPPQIDCLKGSKSQTDIELYYDVIHHIDSFYVVVSGDEYRVRKLSRSFAPMRKYDNELPWVESATIDITTIPICVHCKLIEGFGHILHLTANNNLVCEFCYETYFRGQGILITYKMEKPQVTYVMNGLIAVKNALATEKNEPKRKELITLEACLQTQCYLLEFDYEQMWHGNTSYILATCKKTGNKHVIVKDLHYYASINLVKVLNLQPLVTYKVKEFGIRVHRANNELEFDGGHDDVVADVDFLGRLDFIHE